LIFVKKEDRKMNSGLIISILIYIGYNLLYGLTGGVDNAAHIGGLVSGFAVGTITSLIKREDSDTTPQENV
jgi:rhomboid protease GluP